MKNIMKDLSKIEEAVEKTIHFEIFGEELPEKDELPEEPVELPEEEKGYLENAMKQLDGIAEKADLLYDNLIPGGKTKTGKQKYKYVDENGNVKELLPNSAKSKGYVPYKEEN